MDRPVGTDRPAAGVRLELTTTETRPVGREQLVRGQLAGVQQAAQQRVGRREYVGTRQPRLDERPRADLAVDIRARSNERRSGSTRTRTAPPGASPTAKSRTDRASD